MTSQNSSEVGVIMAHGGGWGWRGVRVEVGKREVCQIYVCGGWGVGGRSIVFLSLHIFIDILITYGWSVLNLSGLLLHFLYISDITKLLQCLLYKLRFIAVVMMIT